MREPNLEALEGVITAAIKLAMAYRDITGKPLGITGEVGEYHAAKLLGLHLADARQPGYDAVAQMAIGSRSRRAASYRRQVPVSDSGASD